MPTLTGRSKGLARFLMPEVSLLLLLGGTSAADHSLLRVHFDFAWQLQQY